MPISIGSMLDDWGNTISIADLLAASTASSSTGSSVQESGDFGQSLDAFSVGKLGPIIGKWDPETTSRFIQEL